MPQKERLGIEEKVRAVEECLSEAMSIGECAHRFGTSREAGDFEQAFNDAVICGVGYSGEITLPAL